MPQRHWWICTRLGSVPENCNNFLSSILCHVHTSRYVWSRFAPMNHLIRLWKYSSSDGGYSMCWTVTWSYDDNPAFVCMTPGTFFEVCAYPHLHKRQLKLFSFLLLLLLHLPLFSQHYTYPYLSTTTRHSSCGAVWTHKNEPQTISQHYTVHRPTPYKPLPAFFSQAGRRVQSTNSSRVPHTCDAHGRHVSIFWPVRVEVVVGSSC